MKAASWLVIAAVLAMVIPPAYAEDGYGKLTGQFILKGDVPELEVLIEKGDATVKDSQVCAANTLHKNTLVVNKDNKGIQNIFIYLREADDIHPDLEETPKDQQELIFDQRNCRFEPHAMFVRTDQTVRVLSDDNCAHNFHSYPIRNQPVNFLMRPLDREGQEVTNKRAEILPIQVKCDIHTWMKAYWLILDHPYAAVTDGDGKFEIDKLPEGKYEFRVWHERIGYIERALDVQIKSEKTTDLGAVEVERDRFKDE